MNTPIIVFSTTGSEEEAIRIADHLITNNLAACVNIVPSILSIYRWKEEINRDREVLLIVKTDSSRFEEIKVAVRSLHSYETPELIAIPIQDGLKEYMDWLTDSVSDKKA